MDNVQQEMSGLLKLGVMHERELAQLKWAEAVVAEGGDAQFCSGEGTL